MSKHLSQIQAQTRLSLGKSIAQFISHTDESDYTIIMWLTIDKGDEKSYCVAYHEVFDEGDESNLNIHEFSELNPEDLPYGMIDEFDTIDQAMNFANETYAASVDKYVPESMIDEEYADYLRSRGQLG